MKVFDYLSEKFGIVVDTTNKDIVPYLKELGNKIVEYEKSIAIMWIIFGIALAALCLIIFFIGCAKDLELRHYIALIGVVIGVFIIMYNMYTYIGCVTFEEKIILDYIEEFIRTSGNTTAVR